MRICIYFIIFFFTIQEARSFNKVENQIISEPKVEKQFQLLNNYYTDLIKSKDFASKQTEIVDFAINLATAHEEKINIVVAYNIVNLTYKRLFTQLTDKKAKKDVVYFLSYYLMVLNQDKTASQVLLKNLENQKITNEDLQSITLLTKLLINRGDFQKAIEWCDKGILVLTNKNPGLGLKTNKIHAYLSLGNYATVISLSETYESDFVKNKEGYASHFFNNYGETYLKLKNYTKARNYFTKANQVSTDQLHKLLEGETNIAISYQEEGNYQKSIDILQKIIGEIEKKYKGFSTYEMSRIFKIQAKNYYLLRHNEVGNNFMNLAQRNLNYKGSIKNFQGSKVELLQLFSDKIKFGKDSNLLKLNTILSADSLIDAMRHEQIEQTSKLFWREKTYSIYESGIEVCFKIKDADKAFYFMEKSRAILLLDAIKDFNAKEALSSSQQAVEEKLRLNIIDKQYQLAALTEKDQKYLITFQKWIAAKDSYNEFITSVEKTNPKYFNLKFDNNYLTLVQVKKILSQNKQAYATYFIGEYAVYALGIANHETKLLKINLDDYNHLTSQFLSLTVKPLPFKNEVSIFNETSNKLFKLIIAPLNLPKGKLVISTSGNPLPYSALITNLKTKRFMLADYAISNAYSANLEFKPVENSFKFKLNLLGMAPVNFDETMKLNPLVGSDKAVTNLEKNYFSGKIFLNKMATKQNFIANCKNFDIIQLFTHTISDTLTSNSALYFSDKSLRLNEIYQIGKLNADLIVLSACKTNTGKKSVGEGILSFARAFAYLNVPCTLSTLWNVDNKATYEITDYFYKYLKDGLPKDVALQKAKTEFLNLNPDKISPFFWSGIVIIGNTDPFTNYLNTFLIIGVLLLITLLFLWKKYFTQNTH